MDEANIQQVSIIDVLRRRWRIMIFLGATLALVAVGLAIGLPATYKSRAVILIEQQEVPQDLVRSLVTSFAEQRLQTISQRVLTAANLSSIVEKYGLYTAERRKEPLEVVLEDMRKDINVKTISADVYDPRQGREMQATIAFELGYEYKSPQLSQRVANELVSLFLNENLKSRTETAELTLSFLTEESAKLGANIRTLEESIAKFKQQHGDQLPELETLTREMLNRSELELSSLVARRGSLEQERAYLESELLQQKPTSGLFNADGQRVMSPPDRLRQAEMELVELTSKYGTQHPDVVRKQKEVDSLRAKGESSSDESTRLAQIKQLEGELASKSKGYSPEHIEIKRLKRQLEQLRSSTPVRQATNAATPTNAPPDNPIYVQLNARLEANRADFRSISNNENELRKKIIELENRLAAMPQVEREYRQLIRDYESASKKYEEVNAKKQEAEVAKSLESEQKGERFTLIEPPQMPEKPASPNRPAIGIIGLILSLLGSAGGAAIRESLDPTIHGRSGVISLVGVPPIAVIPRIKTASDFRHERIRVIAATCGLLALAVVALTMIHFFVTPLDVLWYVFLRKMNT